MAGWSELSMSAEYMHLLVSVAEGDRLEYLLISRFVNPRDTSNILIL